MFASVLRSLVNEIERFATPRNAVSEKVLYSFQVFLFVNKKLNCLFDDGRLPLPFAAVVLKLR